ncbi:MAG TPA: glycosyltransferase family A protein [Thermoanaerobaculia bacterium]|nr:glycosyltransferase family A protein [Thermoanaerobaculia bacterium]
MLPEQCESNAEPEPRTRAGVGTPVITVLLPTTKAWPEIASALDALLAQADAPPFEILVLDGHGRALPSPPPPSPMIRWLRLPGNDPFALRAAGVAGARGEIIAVSEDHCIAPPTWIASIAAAHCADPAAAIVGATMNHPDSAGSAMDRANFLLTFAGQNHMRLDLAVRRLPVPTNLSFKRHAAPAGELGAGELEYRWLATLSHAGAVGVAKSVVLHHRQCWGRSAPRIHFASGRSFGASVREAPLRHRLQWWSSLPLLPLRLASMIWPDLRAGAAGRRPSMADALCVAILIAANVCGQIAGAAIGAGDSRASL